MSGQAVIVIGAGGHGLVVADALLRAGREVLGFVDADTGLHGASLLGLRVLGGDEQLADRSRSAIVLANGIGGPGDFDSVRDGTLRRRVQGRLQAAGWRFCSVVHPAAVVSAHADLAEGAQVLAGAVVQPAARVGHGAIVNTRAVIEHHARVDDFAHVAPGAVLCGHVHVGAESHVGAGAVVRQGLVLGARVVVGAGAAVVRDVSQGVVAGVPAREMRVRP
jgi:sugar O-acyltransferase (sialic acid O-acetyltransferase NeuD family)